MKESETFSMPRARTEEIDLHGLTVLDALGRFKQAYDKAASSGRITRLIVIHGTPSNYTGSIADELHQWLKRSAIRFTHPFDGNGGRTCVHISARGTPRPKRPSAGGTGEPPIRIRRAL